MRGITDKGLDQVEDMLSRLKRVWALERIEDEHFTRLKQKLEDLKEDLETTPEILPD